MKFRWKIFFIFISFITLIFSIFGAWMVNATFQTSLEREIDRGKSENQMFQFAFEMALDSLGEEYVVMQDSVFQDISNSMRDGSAGGESFIRVYDRGAKLLFDNTGMRKQIWTLSPAWTGRQGAIKSTMIQGRETTGIIWQSYAGPEKRKVLFIWKILWIFLIFTGKEKLCLPDTA